VGNLDAFSMLQQISLAALKIAAVAIPPLMLIGLIDRVLNFMPWSIAYRALGKPWLFVRLDTLFLERTKAAFLASEQVYRSRLGEWQLKAETLVVDQAQTFNVHPSGLET
jgi:hypothetical protein